MEDDNEKVIDALISEYGKLADSVLALVVQRCESTDGGKAVVETNPNRKVYAVARPTHEEYLERLGAFLKLTDGQEAEFARLYLHAALPAIKFSWCLSLHFNNGAITREAALDLHKRMWGDISMDAPIARILSRATSAEEIEKIGVLNGDLFSKSTTA